MPHKDRTRRLAYYREYSKRPEVRERERVKHRTPLQRAAARTSYRKNARKYILRRYALTPEGFASILERQDGGYAICGGTERLCVDHCHESDHIRCILCAWCNTGLGGLRDDPRLLRLVIRYLGGDSM